MAADNGQGGVLDLSEQQATPLKVKLPNGQLYDVANPDELGVGPMQKFVSRYRRANELMGKDDADDEEVDEMLSLLLDCAQLILPDAPRDEVGRLGLSKLERLIEAFSSASPATNAPAGEASTTAS